MSSDGWQSTSFGKIAILRRDPVAAKDIEGDSLYVGLEHIGQGTLSLQGVGRGKGVASGKSRFVAGDVLFGKLRPYFRKVVRPTFDGVCSTDIWVIRAREQVDPGFLFYLVAGQDFVDYANSGSSGTRMPRANWSHVEEFRVALPPLEEQRAIAEVLGSLDDRIAWQSHLIDHLEALGAEILHGVLLRHGVSTDKPLSPDARVKIDNFIEVLESGTRPKGGVGSIHEGIPSIGAESIEGAGRFDFSRTRFVPVDFFARMRRGHVENRDVLVYKDGGKPGLFIPHVSIAGDQFPFDRCVINDHVYRVRTRQPYGQAFLYFWLRTQQSTQEMALRGTGAAQPGLNQTNFREVPLPRLPESELLQLDEQLDHLLTLMFRAAREQQFLSSMRDTLLPRLVSGELRIEDPERLLDRVA